ncbi:MAG: efflux RND transporter periplasmic adaptor subunit [Chitinivibrionales bacterium]|nr:efflux RND transporter periplasmic adaptor subunit [Chitinivibrionales bacterium]MBD3358352.1 efflux RND transporter periplasmic adaptor subunit [Chitinivibrionales bacterium]
MFNCIGPSGEDLRTSRKNRKERVLWMAEQSKFKKYLLPALIVGAAVVLAIVLVVTRREPPRAQRLQQAPLVETHPAYPDTHTLTISVYGTVVPAREVGIVPQVNGRIVWVNPNFVPGGIVKEGELLFVVDSSDYVVAVREAQSALQEAEARLEQEKGQQEVARREWELFSDELDTAEVDRELALRQPQLRTARAAVQAAEARLERARLNLSRTRVYAPFNGFIRNEDADVGQLVSTQSRAGEIVGTDKYWVRVAIPEERIPMIAIPGVNADTGSPVLIRHVVGGREIERRGRVERLLGDVEPEGRMARLLVSIEDPLGLGDAADTAEVFMPLLVDAYVQVFIRGPKRGDLYEIPRLALRNGNQLFVVGPDTTLSIIEPAIVWRNEDSVYVSRGLSPGDLVITSPLASPVEGMKIRLPDTKSTVSDKATRDTTPGRVKKIEDRQ